MTATHPRFTQAARTQSPHPRFCGFFINRDEPKEVRFDLVWIAGGWRIDDIVSPNDTPASLRQGLRAEISELEKANSSSGK